MLLQNTTTADRSYISTFGAFTIPASASKEVCDSTVSVCPEALIDIAAGTLVIVASVVPASILDVNATVTVSSGQFSIEDDVTHLNANVESDGGKGALYVQSKSLATSALQTTGNTNTSNIYTRQGDGNQKSQVVDGAGNVIGSTGNALDINIKTGNITGFATEKSLIASTEEVGTATVLAVGLTLTDTNKNWKPNVWSSYNVKIYAGTGAGQVRRVISNTATVLTVDSAWNIQPTTDSEYSIIKGCLTLAASAEEVGTATVLAVGLTLTDTNKNWVNNIWINYNVKIITGTGVGQIRKIASNTATVLTVTTAWAVQPSTDSEYSIIKGYYTAITNEPAVALKYVGTTAQTAADWTPLLQAMLKAPTTKTIVSLAIATKDVDTTVSLVGAIRNFQFKLRDENKTFRVYQSSGGNYMTIPAGGTYYGENVNLASPSFLFQTADDTQVLEYEYWI